MKLWINNLLRSHLEVNNKEEYGQLLAHIYRWRLCPQSYKRNQQLEANLGKYASFNVIIHTLDSLSLSVSF